MKTKTKTRALPTPLFKVPPFKSKGPKELAQTPVVELPEILFMASYPPRECGIATYTQDLVNVLNTKFDRSFKISICALESLSDKYPYGSNVTHTLNTDEPSSYEVLADKINRANTIKMVVIQHEFGFFQNHEENFNQLLETITKPIIIVFHTVLPNPDKFLRQNVQRMSKASVRMVVMTNYSKNVLATNYGILQSKIEVIPHGTHLVKNTNKEDLKLKYGLSGKKVLATFGLLSSGKSIETTLSAIPELIIIHPETMFLVIGKTHPQVVKNEGEDYRTKLEILVSELGINAHVAFINSFLHLDELLEYLQLTDVYLFTSKNPNQAVSGTFSYAISSGCPIVSTPIPHALEVLGNGSGIIVGFENPPQLAKAVLKLLGDDGLRSSISLNGLHRIAQTAWENAAISHARLFKKIAPNDIILRYNAPIINLTHIKNLTTDFGMIQFSKMNRPDLSSGYTVDDNARAMIAMVKYFEATLDESVLALVEIYFNFIKHCFTTEGHFFNYVNAEKKFSPQNEVENLEDANGRAIWALGYLISVSDVLPGDLKYLGKEASYLIEKAMPKMEEVHSTRAMAFIIKGLYYQNTVEGTTESMALVQQLANRLVQMYLHEADKDWQWFESYFTYANSILPEAMLCAWLATKEPIYKKIAKSSFDFLLSKTFKGNNIHVISNKSWLVKGKEPARPEIGGEQPIDVAYTILALNKFYEVFKDETYKTKLVKAFDWFLGDNHLHQIIYNPRTGGCYDGLEDSYINLNQGAESSVSYLLARLAIEDSFKDPITRQYQKEYFAEVNK